MQKKISTIKLVVPEPNSKLHCNVLGCNNIWALCKPAGNDVILTNGILIYLIKPTKFKLLNTNFPFLLTNTTTNHYNQYKTMKLAQKEINKGDSKHSFLLFSYYHKTKTQSYFVVTGFGPRWK